MAAEPLERILSEHGESTVDTLIVVKPAPEAMLRV